MDGEDYVIGARWFTRIIWGAATVGAAVIVAAAALIVFAAFH